MSVYMYANTATEGIGNELKNGTHIACCQLVNCLLLALDWEGKILNIIEVPEPISIEQVLDCAVWADNSLRSNG